MDDKELSRLYHSPLFKQIREYFEHADPKETIFLYVPYIKTKVLEKLLQDLPNRIVIITTWRPRDIQFGSSELELWPFCKARGIALYVLSNLHLKLYSVELQSAILATGNISHRGLLPGGNYEVATKLRLGCGDRMYFEQIRAESRLVDDAMYEKYLEWHKENQIEAAEEIKLEDIIPSPKRDDFAISALPMTYKIDDLISGYARIMENQVPSEDEETAACIFHDIANYGMPPGLEKSEFRDVLAENFFAHPFIQKIDEFIDPEAYFGRIKEWIQDNCTDVPVPSRRELTGNVQVLLEWFERLGDGKYVIDVPGAKSQRIRKNMF